MLKRRTLKTALAAVISLAVMAAPAYANRVMAMATAVVITGTVVTMAIAAIMVTTVTVATMAIKGKIKASPLKITANGKTTASPTT
ncbi:inner membrane protein [Klebsiella pneumoniae]|nr:inner membrane protein [Klebsiella pneumoniae]